MHWTPLLPFPSGESFLKARLQLSSTSALTLHFEWDPHWAETQKIRGLLGAPQQGPAARAHELWKTTCFEAFVELESGYLEFNLSSTGQWNVYRFESYRTPSPPEEAPDWQLDEFSLSSGVVQATFRHAISQELGMGARIGLTAVIESSVGELAYWALFHPRTEPDFHHPDGFVGKLKAV